jgi:hypothetical protein
MALMHDQLKPDRLTWRNNDILRLTANARYRIGTSNMAYPRLSVAFSATIRPFEGSMIVTLCPARVTAATNALSHEADIAKVHK